MCESRRKQWGEDAQKDLEEWRLRTSEAINRRLDSAEFSEALPDAAVPEGPDAPSDARGKSWFQDAFDKAGRFMGGATRDIVYSIGKNLGFKFKPWGAVKLARTLGKVGAVMAVVGVAWDIADFFLDERRQAKREEARKELAEWLAKTVPIVVEAVAAGDDDEPGLLRAAAEHIATLDAYLCEIQAEQEAKQAAIAEVDAHRAVYASLQAKAESALGGNIWEEA